MQYLPSPACEKWHGETISISHWGLWVPVKSLDFEGHHNLHASSASLLGLIWTYTLFTTSEHIPLLGHSWYTWIKMPGLGLGINLSGLHWFLVLPLFCPVFIRWRETWSQPSLPTTLLHSLETWWLAQSNSTTKDLDWPAGSSCMLDFPEGTGCGWSKQDLNPERAMGSQCCL